MNNQSNKKIIIIIGLLSICILSMLSGCADSNGPTNAGLNDEYYYPGDEEHTVIKEKGFVKAVDEPTTYVSLDSSTANYGYFRDQVLKGQKVDPLHVNIEEMLNYFKYDYPEQRETLKLFGEIGVCPWNTTNKLLSYTVKAQDINFNQGNGNNLVFLIDISGSMQSRLELIKESFKLLVDNLGDDDIVSLVTYNNNMRVVFKGLKGSKKPEILDYIFKLQASGGTSFSSAIGECYNIAAEYKISGGNNRIILATDGDFNIGVTGTNDLASYMKTKASSGIYFSACGFGIGNRKSEKLDSLARNGNGTAAYIDSVKEAKKVFIEEIGANFLTVAKDAKAEISFNPYFIEEYRLLGYETRNLSSSDYEDDQTDAGEINSGHVVTIMVELKMTSQYQDYSGEWSELNVKYKEANDEFAQAVSKEISYVINNDSEKTGVSYNFLFASCVVEACLVLRNSNYKGNSSFQNVIERLEQLLTTKTDSYKNEFLMLVKKLRDKEQ